MNKNEKIIVSDYKGRQTEIDSNHWMITHKCACDIMDAEFVLYYKNISTNESGWVCQHCMGLIRKDNNGEESKKQ